MPIARPPANERCGPISAPVRKNRTVRRRKGYVRAIGATHGVSVNTVQRIAHAR
jgi:hypothetical protein